MDKSLKSIKSKKKLAQFKLCLLRPKKRKRNAVKNMSTISDLDNSKSSIDNRDLSTTDEENRNKVCGESYTELKIDKDNDTTKFSSSKQSTCTKVFEKYVIKSESFINLNKELESNNSESSINNTGLHDCPNIFKSNVNQIESNDNMQVLQKSMKRRIKELKNSKSNNSKKSRTDKEILFSEEDPQNDEIIANQKIDGRRKPKSYYNAISVESSKLNDENGVKISESIVEQSQMREEKKSDANKTKTSYKAVKRELNNSESLIEDNVINGINETNSKNLKSEIDTSINNGPELSKSQYEEIDSKNCQAESDTVKDNAPELSKSSQLISGPELNNSKSNIDSKITRKSLLNLEINLNKNHKQLLISQSIVDTTIMEKHSSLSEINDGNYTEKSEIKVEQSKTPKKNNSDMQNEPEINITKPKTNNNITSYFSRSKSINENDINEKVLEQPQERKLRRKSISKALFEATAIVGDHIKAEAKTESSQLNSIKINTSKRLKSTTNILKNVVQIELQNSEHKDEPAASKSIDDLINSKSSIDNSSSNLINGNFLNEEDDDCLTQKKESRHKSTSNPGSPKLFDEQSSIMETLKSTTNIRKNEKDLEQPQERKLRRKSISKSLFDATAIVGNHIEAEAKTESSKLNSIKTNTRKRLKSTTNIRKNVVPIELQNSEQKDGPAASKSIDDLINSKSSIDNLSSNLINENSLNEEDDDCLTQKKESRHKSTSNPGSPKLFDEQKSIMETLKSVSENDLGESFEELQQIPEEPIKRGRGRPKSTVPKPPKMIKMNITTQLKKLKLKPGRKVTKHSIKETSYRKIPQNRLEDALEMLKNEDNPIWEDRNVSCNAGIHRYWEPRNALMSDQNMKLKYARKFLLRRDWLNLSKVLCLSTIDTKQKTNYYPLLSKYATLCLAHTDKEQFNKFVQFLVGMDDASSSVLKKCTKIIQENEE